MFPLKNGLILLLLAMLFAPSVGAIPSGGDMPPSFTYRSGNWYDDWGLTRDSAEGNNGYLPMLFSETIEENAELAWSIGEDFYDQYSNANSRADAILSYVQRWTKYGYDEDNVVMGREAQAEWAWNADETANSFDPERGIVAIGDCEDLAFLSATIYSGAGYETAIIDAVDHVALLVWLPDYPNANAYWDLSGDDRGAGWIWVEATGSENPVGWTPSDYFENYWSAYTYSDGKYHHYEPIWDDNVSVDDGDGSGSFDIDLDLILLVVFILFIIFSKIRR
jgi:hypothetical protein